MTASPSRYAKLIVACVGAVVAWRTLATAYERSVHASGAGLADRAAWVTADFDTRLAATIGQDAPIVRLIATHVPRGHRVLVFGTDAHDAALDRNRLVLLRLRLQELLYPLPVFIGVGPIADPAQYVSLLSPKLWLLNLTPEVARPLAQYFELVVKAEGYELSHCLGSKP